MRAVQAIDPAGVVSDRAAETDRLAGQGVVRAVSTGVLALAGVALLYATLAVVAAFVLTASARADEAAHLTTLGLSDRQSWWMLIVEFGPPVALAVIAGAALGLGLFAFLSPGLGLTTIVGALQSAPPGLDASQIGLLALLIAGILGLGVLLGAPAQRRAAWASVRRGLR
jgi:predicted lysophospholipase L1 biosynthesis ABC-type transport system permease subunit